MKLLNLLRRESDISLGTMVFFASISGLANAMVLAIINLSVEHATNDEHSFQHLLLFLVATALFVVSQNHVMVQSTRQVEKILHKVRIRLTDKVRQAELLQLESIGRAELQAGIDRQAQTISQIASYVVMGFQSAFFVIFMILYMAWVSMVSFVIFVAIISICLVVYLKRGAQFQADLMRAMEYDTELSGAFLHVLDGFKEVKLNQSRSQDLHDTLEGISNSATDLKIETHRKFAHQFIFSQSTFYLLMAAMVFVVPRISETFNDTIVKTTSSILFLMGPISSVVGTLPLFANANAAVDMIEQLEMRLDAAIDRANSRRGREIRSFESIELESVSFQYYDPRADTSFGIGPIDFELRQGETVFIVGGNGSGKSTFLKILTSLYYPKTGCLKLDGRTLHEADYPDYRSLFSVIYSDYHLFDRLYGMRDIDAGKVAELLELVELTKKTHFVNDRFDTLDLSTGQRKRLALVVTLLEDRPIYIFDEWAAEQDPEFRRRFYEEFLHDLRQRGKTVVAVTHDDRYYEHADRILRLDEGKFTDV